MTWYELTQAWIAAATLPVTLAFLILFCRPSERWWGTWFGRSLFLLALGVLSYSATTVLWRLFGDYPGRPVLLIASTLLVLIAMTIRTGVLWHSQRAGSPRRFGHIGDAIVVAEVVRDFEATVRRIEQLEPCPNPDCMAFRARLIDMAHRLPTHAGH